MNMKNIKALVGLGPILAPGGEIAYKSRAGWERWAATECRRMNKNQKFTWAGVFFPIDDTTIRINFGGQEERI